MLPESEDQTRMKRKTKGMPLSKLALPLLTLLRRDIKRHTDKMTFFTLFTGIDDKAA